MVGTISDANSSNWCWNTLINGWNTASLAWPGETGRLHRAAAWVQRAVPEASPCIPRRSVTPERAAVDHRSSPRPEERLQLQHHQRCRHEACPESLLKAEQEAIPHLREPGTTEDPLIEGWSQQGTAAMVMGPTGFIPVAAHTL